MVAGVLLIFTGVLSHPSDSPAICCHMAQFTAVIYSKLRLPLLCCYSSLTNERRGGIRLAKLSWAAQVSNRKGPTGDAPQ